MNTPALGMQSPPATCSRGMYKRTMCSVLGPEGPSHLDFVNLPQSVTGGVSNSRGLFANGCALLQAPRDGLRARLKYL